MQELLNGTSRSLASAFLSLVEEKQGDLCFIKKPVQQKNPQEISSRKIPLPKVNECVKKWPSQKVGPVEPDVRFCQRASCFASKWLV